MVDVLRSLGIEYFAATPGNTFMGMHEAVINYGMLTDPPLRTIASVWWPFCLYSGWITVALLANISAWLVKVQWNGMAPATLAIEDAVSAAPGFPRTPVG